MNTSSMWIVVGLLLVLFIAILGACGSISKKESVCDTDQPSVLCDMARKLGVSLDDVATCLKLGNLSGLSLNVYKAKQALDFITMMEGEIGVIEGLGGYYIDFVNVAIKKYTKLPPEVQALFIVFDNTIRLDVPELGKLKLTPYDFGLLRLHLQKQRELILPFLLNEK